ncbi:MAG TPA: phosphoribosylamine--glycine ligase [Syntrophomonadaceae bacterium]|nr:phosphoribosylamine--glycine ligase [Syntrophomonadaceae bacterium]
MGKRVLVVGQGGREHALVWKLASSPMVSEIYAAPGNPGMAGLAQCIDIAMDDLDSLLKFAQDKLIDLTLVGPELPLMLGIVDKFRAAGLKIFGPTKGAAQLEGSKVFTKNLFRKYGIPTADYEVFQDVDSARDYVKNYLGPDRKVVIKVDGLAQGKGVVIAHDLAEAYQAIDSMLLDKDFGEAGSNIVIEEFLAGEEVSVFAVCDGQNYVSLISAQDHKSVFDNDEGPNTGGMGAYVNPPIYNDKLHQEVEKNILSPVVKAMAQEGYPYTGVLYAGLMITEAGPKVLEFNARFGDPETQVVLPMLKTDLMEILEKACDAELKGYSVEVHNGSAVCVVLASPGYPGSYEKGFPIQGLDNLPDDVLVFQAGTAIKDGKLVTNGGRVLGLVCLGDSIKNAIAQVYANLKTINFEGMHYRTDIGKKALK